MFYIGDKVEKLIMKIKAYINRIVEGMKIKTKLIAIYMIVVMIPIFIIGAYMIQSLINIMNERTIDQASSNVNVIKYRLNEVLSSATDVSNRIYINPNVRYIAEHKFTDYMEMLNSYDEADFMGEYLRTHTELRSIRFYVENDTIVNNSYFINANDTVKRSEWYRNAKDRKGSIFWLYKPDEYYSESLLTLVRCIYNSNGKIYGVLTISINPEALKAVIKDEKYETMLTVNDYNITSINDSLLGIRDYYTDYDREIDNENYITKMEMDGQKVTTIINAFRPTAKVYGSKFEVIMAVPPVEITTGMPNVLRRAVICIAVCIIISLAVILYFSRSMADRIHVLGGEMHKVALGKFDIKNRITGNDEIASLYDDLNLMKESLKNLIDEVYVEKIRGEQLKIKQQEAQFKVLASQINPHFLYNTLETIRMKAYCNNQKEIADLVKMLGKIMRRNLEATDKEVTIKSEIELLENYLKIQQARFGDKVDYECNAEIDDSKLILPLLIQPVVENAFVHGIEKSLTNGKITINIFEEQKHTVIEIRDDGVGMDEEQLQKLRDKISSVDNNAKKSIGLTNVNQRIKIFYGDEYGMYIESIKGKGTDVILTLPILEGDSDYVKSIDS